MTKFRAVALLPILLALAVPASATVLQSPWEVIGVGNKPCSDWTADRAAKGQGYAMDGSWLTGALSGINGARGGDITDGREVPTLLGIMDAYCADEPDRTISDATRALIAVLIGQSPQAKAVQKPGKSGRTTAKPKP